MILNDNPAQSPQEVMNELLPSRPQSINFYSQKDVIQKYLGFASRCGNSICQKCQYLQMALALLFSKSERVKVFCQNDSI